MVFKTVPSDGSYAYTRFGVSAAPATPTVVINASAEGSKIDLVADQQVGGSNLVGTVNVSVLIRDNTGWFASSTKSVPSVTSATTYTYVLAGSSAVTWNALSQSTDIDQVDNDGELALTVDGPATPDLSKIEGMGIMLRSTATSGDGSVQCRWWEQTPTPAFATGNTDSPHPCSLIHADADHLAQDSSHAYLCANCGHCCLRCGVSAAGKAAAGEFRLVWR